MKITTGITFLFFTSVLMAQLEHPKASPAATTIQKVGLSTIQVDYSRPAVRGRSIFGDLVPYGRIWRVGANASTKITFDTNVTIDGAALPKGTYALYAFPEADEWEIIFHKNTTHWGDGRKEYDASQDALRVKIVPFKDAEFQENFLINFANITHDKVDMLLVWANTRLAIPIEVNTQHVMEVQIAAKLAEKPTAQTYYEVARYYIEQDIKHQEALKYLNKAIVLGGDTYYFYRVKSLAQAALGDFEPAIISAQKSLELAQKEDKDEFVRMNQKNIDFWKEKVKLEKED